jgi:hypothetical protein
MKGLLVVLGLSFLMQSCKLYKKRPMQTIKIYSDKTIARIEIDSAVSFKNNNY